MSTATQNCEFCHSPAHVWFNCPKKPDGWKPERLKSRPQHVHEKRATADGDVMAAAPVNVPDPAPQKARPTPTRKQLERIAAKRVAGKQKQPAVPDMPKTATVVTSPKGRTARIHGDRVLTAEDKKRLGTMIDAATDALAKRTRGRPISPHPKSPRAEYQRDLMRKRRAKAKP